MTVTVRYGRYLVMAVLIGGFWYLNRDSPLWEEVVRTVVVFALIMVALRFVLGRKGVTVHLVPLIAGKALLVVLAGLLEEALRSGSVAHASLITASALGVALFVLGATFNGYFFTGERERTDTVRPAADRA